MVWSTHADDAKMLLLDIPFTMNHVIIEQLALNLVDICLNNMLQIYIMEIVTMFCKNLERLTTPKLQNMAGKIVYVQLQNKWYISLSFQQILTILISKFKLGYDLSKIKENLKTN